MTSAQATEIARDLQEFISQAVRARNDDTTPVKPKHRVPFHWPPHPISKDYHVLPSDWTGKTELVAHGETFDVDIARTAQGVFGRIDKVWNEARADTVEDMLAHLVKGAEPYFRRQFDIGTTLGTTQRYTEKISRLEPTDQVKLLYCPDRDVAHEAQLAIETRASTGLFAPALVLILRDDRHPNRRSAQWCVLDMFEDLPSFCPDPADQADAVDAIRALIWSASDDYARTVYKAGVVLGGHICTPDAAEALISCVTAPSKFGRRSAIHAVFHLAEWMPEFKQRILDGLDAAASSDEDPALREFAHSMARDVRAGSYEHMTEPAFPEEN